MTAQADLDLQKMRHFYELFPYPNRPLFLEPDPQGSFLAHAGFSTWVSTKQFENARRVWQATRKQVQPEKNASANTLNAQSFFKTAMGSLHEAFSNDKKILLVGCGTDEPILFRVLHPQNEIVGVDLSSRTLKKARLKLWLHGFRSFVKTFGKSWWTRRWSARTKLHHADAAEFLGTQVHAPFDHIQCFGVLHHQPNPRRLLETISESLGEAGTLRIMIYSHKGRRLERRIQNRYSDLWSSLMSSEQSFSSILRLKLQHFLLRFWQIYNFAFHSGPASYRFKYLGLSSSTVADALLHPSDPGLPPSDLFKWCTEFGLKLVFCEARLETEGWTAGFADAAQVWDKIVEADSNDSLLSNIVAVFKKEKSNNL